MKLSKTQIDKAGRYLSAPPSTLTMEQLEYDEIFDTYRKDHLQPLTSLTNQLQHWLASEGIRYYIAQRLKRKPQILRKLKRLTVRLTQLQDIGGCRIIVTTNKQVDEIRTYLENKIESSGTLNLVKATDYRELGRDDTGYRALHLIIEHQGRTLELQLRSDIQHYWAESIERTSVVYGHHLKEGEGDKIVIEYFKLLSRIFFELELARTPSDRAKRELDQHRVDAEAIIEKSPRSGTMSAYVNEGILATLSATERSAGAGLNNWIFVFDWNTGSFLSWDIASPNPDEAAATYSRYEKEFPAENNYEVVLIGSSDVATVRRTHSHYFGVAAYDKVLENLQESIVGFSRRMDLDIGARQILMALARKNMWGTKRTSEATLRNHFCKRVLTFDSSLTALKERGLILHNGGIALDSKQKREIEKYL